MTTTADITDQFTAQWQQWHGQREESLRAPLGWLSINRLEWLDETPQRYDGIPGVWHHDGVAAYVTAEAGDVIDVDGAQRFETGATAPGTIVHAGNTDIEVAHRGAGYVIRVHDPEAQSLRDFRGIPTFEPDSQWVLSARFEPYESERSVTVGSVAEGLEHVYSTPGEVVIERDGVEHRLVAFNGNGGVSFLFTDETSGVSTYRANRTVTVPAAAEVLERGGEVLVDFNRASNLPCAFIDFATCPLPPAGNHLSFEVNAGEKTPWR